MFKIGVLSDTHLRVVSNDLKELLRASLHDIDMLIHAGDMTSARVFDFLQNWNIKAVRGNMDDFELYSMIPQRRIEVINGKRFGIIHGSGSPQGIEKRVKAGFGDDVDVIIFGHSHIPARIEIDGVTLFNPGSFRDSRTAGIIEISDNIDFRFISIK
ncbi:MAG: metallophosphoesterase [Syntrophorhabdales bacterium]|nr:metallophosphoesterase [Syntrophorhabdales bacterium]